MGFTSLDLIKGLLESNIFGNAYLLGLFVISFFIIILLIARSFPEVALMIPFPLIIALAESGIVPNWIKPLAFILAGFYLAVVVLIFTGLTRR